MEDKNIMISLDDQRVKYLSDVLTNKSCKKIIDFLISRDATVSDVSKELKMPINTADYNIKKLEKSGLIEKKSYWWSTRGKKMPTYTVSHKQIIISPRKVFDYTKYLFALILTGFLSFLLKISNLGQEDYLSASDISAINVGEQIVEDAGISVLETTKREVLEKGSEIIIPVAQTSNLWLWFLAGCWLTILIFFIFSYISEYNNK
jgi:DNA-binding transcriptional ArsR family regulator